jgi:hypothetical protein
MGLLGKPQDIPFLSGLIQREIIYRILRGRRERACARLQRSGGQSHRTAKAIAWITANYAQPLRVEQLAEIANMGVSTAAPPFPGAHRDESAPVLEATPAAGGAWPHATEWRGCRQCGF